MNPLWMNLSSKVVEMLKERRILFPHDPSQEYLDEIMRRPLDLRTLPKGCLDLNGSPLFADRPGINRRYLSLRYEKEDIEVLKTAFDLEDISDTLMFHRIKQDLLSATSMMKDPGTDDNWHSLAADLITSILVRSPDVGRMIKEELYLIPLNDGGWVRASTEDLFFPSQNGPAIPQDLVVTIHPEAARNTSRVNMFSHLGADYFPPARVIDILWTYYVQRGGASDLDDSKGHLMYLYWHYANSDDRRFSRLWLFDNHLNKVTCRRGLIYMPSDDDYGPRELLKSVPDPGNPRRTIQEYAVPYLNTGYVDLFYPHIRRHNLSWLDWLEKVLGVRRIPRLKYDAGALSTEFRHILSYRPEKIIATLRNYWPTYRNEMSTPIEEEISQAEVTCLDAPPAVLSTTYFPLQSLLQKAQELGISRGFPFLVVPGLSDGERAFEDWTFLKRFSVKFDANLEFFLDILRQHEAQTQQPWNADTRNGIVKTYELIADHCNEISRAMLM